MPVNVFEDADEVGFVQASGDEVDGVLLAYRKELGQQKSINRRILVAATKQQMRVAGDSVLYFDDFADWRGRVYYHGAGLAPQGKDFGRGCLQAAEGAPLRVSGLRHLMIGVATTWGQDGLDKASMRKRVAGIKAMVKSGDLARIVKGALDNSDFTWRLADEPTQFIGLAADLLAARASGNAFTYKSAMFVGYDATCSGLQIMAAVTGCTDTALLVNVTPRADGKRADIYLSVAAGLKTICAQIVAERGEAEMETGMEMDRLASIQAKADSEAGIKAPKAKRNSAPVGRDHWALYWHKRGINRSDTKTPVMVYCYGGSKRTFAAALREETGAPWKACIWLASKMYDDVLAGLLPKAHAFMLRLQQMARKLAQQGKPVAFRTTDGLPFEQAVMETEKDQFPVVLPDRRRLQIVAQKRLETLSVQRQASGVAPNIVHHWDSLFLRNAIRALRAAGITHFFTVHDCFYLRAADWSRGWAIIRRAFVDTFKADVGAALWAQIAEISGVDIGPAPERGSLDLELAMESEFLFS